jgi:hypothetical protein
MKLSSGVKRAITAFLAATVVLVTSSARANGRFPRGQQLIEFPTNPNRLILAATYGLVTSDDGGKNWYYVCETAFSYYPPPSSTETGFNGDPLLALTADNSLLVNVQERINKSSDAACGWVKSLEPPKGNLVEDIAVAPSNRNIAFALVRANNMTQLHESTDGGANWAPIGTPLPNIVVAYTLDVDPKDPAHIMATGITSYDAMAETGVFLNTTNRGTTWTTSAIPKTNIDAGPYIAAVHPTDPKIVFVRTNEWFENPQTNVVDARDALLYTKDGGQTWTELLRPMGPDGPGAKLFGFAISPDGSTVLAGFGDPVDGSGRTVDRELMGIYKSTGPDFSFGPTPKPSFIDSVSCLTWTAKGIYLCGSPDGPASNAYIGFATDANNLTAAGITKIMEAGKMKGEPACCAGRAVSACDWATECGRFSACDDAGTLPPGPDAAVCMMPDGGSSEGGADADGGGTGGSAGGDAGRDMSTGGSSGAGAGGAGTAGASGGMAGAGRAGAAGAGGAGAGGAGAGGVGAGGVGAGTAGSGGSGTGGAGGGDDDACSCRLATSSQARSTPTASLLLGLIGASAWRRSRRRRGSAA